MLGVFSSAKPIKSFFMITTVKPAGPIFFWAPAKIKSYLETSVLSLKIQLDKSATNNFPSCGGSSLYLVP